MFEADGHFAVQYDISEKKKLLHPHAYTVLFHTLCERRIRSRFVATCYDNHCLGNALHHPEV